MKSAEAVVIQELIEVIKKIEKTIRPSTLKVIARAERVANADRTFSLLTDIVDDADDTGCEYMFTVAECYIKDAGRHVRKAKDESATPKTRSDVPG